MSNLVTVEKYYDGLAPTYDDALTAKGWAANELLGVNLQDYPGRKTAATALDLGAGTGLTTAVLLGELAGASVTAVDVSQGMLDVLKRRFPANPRLYLARMAIEDYLRTSNCTFDVIASAGALQFSPNIGGIIHWAAKLLNPGGCFFTTYNPQIEGLEGRGLQHAPEEVIDGGVTIYRQPSTTLLEEVASAGLTTNRYGLYVSQPQGDLTIRGGYIMATKPIGSSACSGGQNSGIAARTR